MKKIFGILASAVILLSLSSCDSRQSLAKDINGSWSASPDRITETETMSTGVIRFIDFIKAPSEAGGDVIISSLVSVSSQLPAGEEITEPISMTASGVASVRGTWVAQSDDEVVLVLDPESFNVQVDTSAVVLTANTVTGEQSPDLASLKPSAVNMVRDQITRTVRNDFFSIQKIDDIKINGNMMSCEINNRDLTLRRQTEEQ